MTRNSFISEMASHSDWKSPKYDLQELTMTNFASIIEGRDSREFLKSFLIRNHKNQKYSDTSVHKAGDYLLAYEICEKILFNSDLYEFHLHELLSQLKICKFSMKKNEIMSIIDDFKYNSPEQLKNHINNALKQLQWTCICKIECSPEITSFRGHLLKKAQTKNY